MRQASDKVVAGRRDEDLRLMLQAPERLAMDDSVTVSLELRSDWGRLLGGFAAPRLRALGRMQREAVLFLVPYKSYYVEPEPASCD